MTKQSKQGETKPPTREMATLAGGCFWCLEAVFEQLQGVEKVVSGYTGGKGTAPTYQQVCSGNTGHAEVVQVTFDPQQISYHDLLEVFFSVHDPTTLNRQGADVGTQYRSVIFAHTPEQRLIAERTINEIDAQKIWDDPIVTQVVDAPEFYSAEAYHQNYYTNNPNQGYCRVVIAPKVAKCRSQQLARLQR
jgi:peptide-methionine (S)-S-oxide reductase